MKKTYIILLLLFSFSLQGQTIYSFLDSITVDQDTTSFIAFCEKWHLETKDCRITQINNDTIKEMYELLEGVFHNYSLIPNVDDTQQYLVIQDFILLSVQDTNWDFENAVVELELVKKKKRFDVLYRKSFRLKELKQNDLELYKKGFKEYYLNNYRYRDSDTLIGMQHSYFTEFCPKLGKEFKGIKPCYLIGRYKEFSEFTGGLSNPKEFFFSSSGVHNKRPEKKHYQNVDFIEQIIMSQSGYSKNSRLGINRITFNKFLNKAAIYEILPCYTGYLPQLYEKVNGKWESRGRYWNK